MHWNEEQQAIIDRYAPYGHMFWMHIPDNERRYKCYSCYMIINHSDLRGGACPHCGDPEALREMCPLDHVNCTHDVLETTAICPLCGEFICPSCGSHDVSVVSRVTGYLADVAGWNHGKRQELKDRQRYDIATQR